jgi:hypothetical protein
MTFIQTVIALIFFGSVRIDPVDTFAAHLGPLVRTESADHRPYGQAETE